MLTVKARMHARATLPRKRYPITAVDTAVAIMENVISRLVAAYCSAKMYSLERCTRVTV